MKIITKNIICICFILISSSCTKNDTGNTLATTIASPIIIPAVTSYGSAYATKTSYQNTSIILNIPDKAFAKEIYALPKEKIYSFPATDIYKYMGSKGMYHFIAHYPPIGLRNILKISKSNYYIENEFSLTSNSNSWKIIKLPTQPLKKDKTPIKIMQIMINGPQPLYYNQEWL